MGRYSDRLYLAFKPFNFIKIHLYIKYVFTFIDSLCISLSLIYLLDSCLISLFFSPFSLLYALEYSLTLCLSNSNSLSFSPFTPYLTSNQNTLPVKGYCLNLPSLLYFTSYYFLDRSFELRP